MTEERKIKKFEDHTARHQRNRLKEIAKVIGMGDMSDAALAEVTKKIQKALIKHSKEN